MLREPSPPKGQAATGCDGQHVSGAGLQRRTLLAAAAAFGAVPLLLGSRSASAGTAPQPVANDTALRFFSAAEIDFVNAAVSRLIPADELGPGAVEAGVTAFIDAQLAGPYGRAVDWYMVGPWHDGTQQQGYQSQRTPAQLYRAAIVAIDTRAKRDDGAPFAALKAGQRDHWLHTLQDGKTDLGDVDGKTFFDMLWQNTQEGFFADPIYAGNRDFDGWKLVGYPGPRYNYVGDINRFGERYPLPTVGLMGRDASRRPPRAI